MEFKIQCPKQGSPKHRNIPSTAAFPMAGKGDKLAKTVCTCPTD